MKKELIFALISMVLLFGACKDKKQPEEKTLTSGIDMNNLDTTVSPAQDFYQFACGGWMKNHPLKAEYSRFGNFDELAEDNLYKVKTLVEEIAAKSHDVGSIPQKIEVFYNLGMDSNAIEAQGATPLQPELQAIANIKDKAQLTNTIAEMSMEGLSPFFGVYGDADPKNSSMNIAHISQSGLGIGDRDYYLNADNQKIRDEYVVLMTNLFAKSGYSKMMGMEGKEKMMAENVLKLETTMAKHFMDKIDERDPHKTYNIVSIDQLQKMVPSIQWNQYFAKLNLSQLESVNVHHVNYMTSLNTILKSTDLNTIKAFLAWQIINSAAPYLNQEFVDADFNFYGKILSGKEENKPRWKRVLNTVDGALGEAVGQIFVEKYFPAEAKDRMLKLVDNLKSALGERIQQTTWMADSTKIKAMDKLHAIIVKIGYPDQWRDYTALKIENDSYYENVVRSRRFETAYWMSKIGQPVDPTLWFMTPQTCNAYYNPSTNEICFPAGILQPPFFDMNADDAANYGAIGVVIGHEMTHGFDDQGRNFDKVGNLNNWWCDDDTLNFNARTRVLVDYFNKIEVYPGTFANGTFTLGENIADNGGVNVSYVALQKAKADGNIQETMDGFTADQRFFLAYAAVWANNIRDEEILRRTNEDPHSLGKWRVNATLPHIDAFIKAFDVKPGDGMYLAPEERAKIW